MVDAFNRLFPLWAVLVAATAVLMPAPLLALSGWVSPLLMLIMFLMGVTLSRADFVAVFRQPRALALGLVLHYTLMPLAAWAIALLLGLSPELTTGMLLVGAVSSGTASNVMCWISGGNVALAVSLAIVSTLLSAVLTPLIVWGLVGQSVSVPVSAMLTSIAKLVLLPVILGVVVHQCVGARIKRWESCLASVAVVSILIIIGVVVAANESHLAQLGPLVALAVILHNGVGLAGGYWGGRLCGLDVSKSRTLAFEVGMQNSALAVTLAQNFFSPMSALPGALFSVWHNISGSLLAAWWKRHPIQQAAADSADKNAS
ncbi:bile acid:sodium symporter family protein [Carnimonas bestiolae]|uniref:bile acid:sodium symporter family protein n=1 Tax=Carnimonas bestiolae TaxID=3402172 RepID=UPI003EDBAB9D